MTSCFRNANDPPAINDTKAKLHDITPNVESNGWTIIKLLLLWTGKEWKRQRKWWLHVIWRSIGFGGSAGREDFSCFQFVVVATILDGPKLWTIGETFLICCLLRSLNFSSLSFIVVSNCFVQCISRWINWDNFLISNKNAKKFKYLK